MRLQIGQRLAASDSAHAVSGYVITGVVRETAWSGLYTARRIFANFDFGRKQPRCADEKEWLEVLSRTVHAGDGESRNSARFAARAAHLRAQASRVLGQVRGSLWPEPLDLLELPGASPGSANEPILVLARPHGTPLVAWLADQPAVEARLTVLAELLDFVAAVHEDGLLLNSLDPEMLLVDRAGRLHYLGSDLVSSAPERAKPSSDGMASLPPPERYPCGVTAPECFEPHRPRNCAADLYSWAAVAYFTLTREDPVELARSQGRNWAEFGPAELAALERVLRAIPPLLVQNWAGELFVDDGPLLRCWPDNLLGVLERALHPDPQYRPQSVAELRQGLSVLPARSTSERPATDEELRSELWRRVFDEGDIQAHQLLVLLLQSPAPASGNAAPRHASPYAADLEAELARRLDRIAVIGHAGRQRLMHSLRQAVTVRPQLAALLQSPDLRVRRFVHECLQGPED
jgi:hypothetical protein